MLLKRNELQLSLALVWPLLAGVAMIMVGNGLQGTLLSLRASLEGFSPGTIGLVMSLYYAGFLAGGYIIPFILEQVGHIRVFAGLASLASTTILLHGVFVDPISWSFVRIISGFSFAGLFIVSESWLNDIAPNRLRAQVLGAYIAVIYSGLFGGQFLLNMAEVGEIDLFILTSVLISLALLPVTLANKPSPGYEGPEKMPYRELMRLSPLALCSVLASGFCVSSMLAMSPVLLKDLNFEKFDIIVLVSAYILGSGIIPLIIGWISDKLDRRKVLAVCAAGGFLVSLVTTFLSPTLLLMALLGGFFTSCYSIAAAYMNDHIPQKKMVSATSSLIMTNGIGSICGPLAVGYSLKFFGAPSFFLTLAFVMLMVIAFGIYRVFTGKKISVEEQGDFTPFPARSSAEIAVMAEEIDNNA